MLVRAIPFVFIVWFVALLKPAWSQQSSINKSPTYAVKKLESPLTIDGNWDKPEWKNVKSVSITNFIREKPAFRPVTEVKMQYDDENIYVIFRVRDRYVRCITGKVNGPVWEDAAVELFFCPDTSRPDKYFNLEINCGGTPLMEYRSNNPSEQDIRSIVIAHSLPKRIDPEIVEPVVWTIEYKVPLAMLEKYGVVTRPAKGVKWKANFYKIAENNSNPHHITWSPVTHPKPHFHMPDYFGTLVFQ